MVIADTGFFLALANRKDRYHDVARSAYTELTEPLVTTWPVMTETCHLLVARLGVEAQSKFIRSYVDGAFQAYTLEPDHGPRILALMKKYADLPMDLADASLVILTESLGHGRILSTDLRDFRSYRWKNRQPFENKLAMALR